MKTETRHSREPNTNCRPTIPVPDGERKHYLIGDGEVKSIRRPGSDHSHIKSHGQPC